MMKLVGTEIEAKGFSEDQIIRELRVRGVLDAIHVAVSEAFRFLGGLRDREQDINFARLRTQRCILNDAVILRAEAALAEHKGFEFVDEPGAECRTLRVPSLGCDIRFKKIDRSNRSSNIPTGRQKRIRYGLGQTRLFGESEREHITLTLGYEPDDELCVPRRIAIGVEGGWSCSIQAPPADTVGVITEKIRAGLGVQTA